MAFSPGGDGGRRSPDRDFEQLGRSLLSLDVLDTKLVGPARQEFIELRLGAHDGRGCDGADVLLSVDQFCLDHAPCAKLNLEGPRS